MSATTSGKKKTKPRTTKSSRASIATVAPQSTLLQGVISAFILFHVVAIFCWAVPLSSPPILAVRQLIRPYMVWSGLFQSWDTFAPSPVSSNTFVKAIAMSQSGDVHVWGFPRMEQLSYSQRYREERYRKFAETLPAQPNSVLWPNVASKLAKSFDSPGDPTEKVMLLNFHADIVPGTPKGKEPTPSPDIFYQEYFLPEDSK